jgi:hypothetical protein
LLLLHADRSPAPPVEDAKQQLYMDIIMPGGLGGLTLEMPAGAQRLKPSRVRTHYAYAVHIPTQFQQQMNVRKTAALALSLYLLLVPCATQCELELLYMSHVTCTTSNAGLLA